MQRYFLTFLLIITVYFCFSQNRKIDSLYASLKKHKADTNKVKALYELADLYNRNGSDDSAGTYVNMSFLLAEKLDYKPGMANALYTKGNLLFLKGMDSEALRMQELAVKLFKITGIKKGLADSHNSIGLIHDARGDFESALQGYFTALKIHEEINNKKGIAAVYNNIGNVYDLQGNYVEAIKNHLSSLKICEETGNEVGIARSYNNIGLIYFEQEDYLSALENIFKALKINEKLDKKRAISENYNNIANTYTELNKYEEALKYYHVALKMKEEEGAQKAISAIYTGIGNVYQSKGLYEEALKNHLKSTAIKNPVNDKAGYANSLLNLGADYYYLKKYRKGIEICNQSLAIAKEIGYPDIEKAVYKTLFHIYEDTGGYNEALMYYKKYINAKDSLLNEENTKKTVKLEMNYEFGKKEAAAKLIREKQEALAIWESKKQKIIIRSVSGVLILVVAFAIFAFRNYRQKQKANEAITRQKEVIEEKQKEILDSIHYARRIQTALLTSEKYIDRTIRDHKRL